MRARALVNRGMSREQSSAVVGLYEHALRLEPDSMPALSGLAWALAAKVADYWSDARDDDLRRAEELALRAFKLDPHDAYCHMIMGSVRWAQNRFEEAIGHNNAAIGLNPNLDRAHANLGFAKALSGRCEEALGHFDNSIRLNPRDPLLVAHFGAGWTRFLVGDDNGAIEILRKVIAVNPSRSLPYLMLAAAYGMLDRTDDAKAAYAGYLRTGPQDKTIAQYKAHSLSKHPAYLALRERTYQGLRRAGMPED